MLLVKMFSVICCRHVVQGNYFTTPTSTYVRNVLQDTNSSNSTTRDVVFMPLGTYKNTKRKVNDIFESKLSEISKKIYCGDPELEARS